MTLRYPSEFNVNMPFVWFNSYEYRAPAPEIIFVKSQGASKGESMGDPIVLYMPGDFSESITAAWGEEELYQGAGGNVGSILVANSANWISNAGAGKVVNSAQASQGYAPLPMDMAIFKHIDPMTISFSFKMIPYNKSEGDTIVKICREFKSKIMPKVEGDENVLMKFPAIWDIRFEGMNCVGIDPYDNGYEFMALTSCNVTYSSGTEGAAVYHDKNPVQINLTLTFQHIKKHWLV